MADQTIWEKLAAPFAESEVKVRVQSVFAEKNKQTKKYPDDSIGMAVYYIDARNVMERFDEVLTPAGWRDEYHVISPNGPVVECTLYVHDENAGWIAKTDVGYPNGVGSTEPAKDAYSDALKRAAVKWGVGRHIYAMDVLKVKVDQHGAIKRILGPMDGKTTAEDITPPGGHSKPDYEADYRALMLEAEKNGRHRQVFEHLGSPKSVKAAGKALKEKSDVERAALTKFAAGEIEAISDEDV